MRPFNAREKAEDGGAKSGVRCKGTSIDVVSEALLEAQGKSFNFDLVLSSDSSQDDVFNAVGAPVVDDALAAYNGCIFAYGQTGSGKTHSMVGDKDDVERGILPRACTRLFQALEDKRKVNTSFEATVLASYLEIYNEKIYDLLSGGSREELEVRLHPQLGAIVTKLTECPILTMPDCQELFDFGMKKRAVAATQMNATSSRSHAVFTVQTRIQYAAGPGNTTESQAKIHFVDLAGSERMKKTGATGDRMKEGIGINQALSVLGRVISDLSSAKPGKKITPPFRESKLTLLLKDALMGNSRTVLLACISPAVFNLEESVGTMEFASRCKLVRTSAQKNEQSRADIILKLTGEKEAVESQLQEERSRREELLRQLQAELDKVAESERLAKEATEQKHRIQERLKLLEDENSDLQTARDDAMAAVELVAAEAAAQAAKAAAASRPVAPTASFVKESPEYKQRTQEMEELEAKLAEIDVERRRIASEQADQEAKARAARADLEREINAKSARERELAAERDALLAMQDSWAIDLRTAKEKAEEEKGKRKAELCKLGVDFLDLDEQDAANAPRLVNLHPDPSLEGCLVYYLPVGRTSAGSDAAKCRVKLSGLSIHAEVCVLENKDNKTLLVRRVEGGLVRVNGAPVDDSGIELKDGDRLAIGRDKIFQVRIPKAATSGSQGHSDFTKAMEELAAGATVNPEWQSALEMVLLMVKSHLGQEVATTLLAQAKKATETINNANEILKDTVEEFRGGVLRYQMSVNFEMLKGMPEVCVTAYSREPGVPTGIPSLTWTLDEFILDRLAVLDENRSLGGAPDVADVVSFFHQAGEAWYTVRLSSFGVDQMIKMRLADFEELDRRIRPSCGGRLPALPDGGTWGLRAKLGMGRKNEQIQDGLQAYIKVVESLGKLDNLALYVDKYESVTSPASPTMKRAPSASRSWFGGDASMSPRGSAGVHAGSPGGLSRARLALGTGRPTGNLTPRDRRSLTPTSRLREGGLDQLSLDAHKGGSPSGGSSRA